MANFNDQTIFNFNIIQFYITQKVFGYVTIYLKDLDPKKRARLEYYYF